MPQRGVDLAAERKFRRSASNQYFHIESPIQLGHARRHTGGKTMQFLRLDQFAAHLNETFMVDIENVRTPFVLVEARPLQHQPMPGLVREPFSLLFRHEAAVVFPQRIYAVSNENMGEFGIFLVPIARDRDGFIYQAVFN
jgi:hypothetical protein